jgi:hypothetical protein
MVKAITLTFRLAEEQKLAVLGFVHPKGFKTNFAALQSLVGQLLSFFNERMRKPRYACCKKAADKNSDYLYCPTCGSKLARITDVETLQSWFVSLLDYSIDNFGSDFSNQSLNDGWEPWENWLNIPAKNRLDILYNAENALICALPVDTDLEDLENFWKNYSVDEEFEGMQGEQNYFINRLNKAPKNAIPEGVLV